MLIQLFWYYDSKKKTNRKERQVNRKWDVCLPSNDMRSLSSCWSRACRSSSSSSLARTISSCSYRLRAFFSWTSWNHSCIKAASSRPPTTKQFLNIQLQFPFFCKQVNWDTSIFSAQWLLQPNALIFELLLFHFDFFQLTLNRLSHTQSLQLCLASRLTHLLRRLAPTAAVAACRWYSSRPMVRSRRMIRSQRM